MLCRSQRECATAIEQAAARADIRRGRSDGRRLIGVGMNFQPQQLSLSGEWSLRHVFFDDVLFGIRACAAARNVDLLLLTEMSSRMTNRPSHFSGICKRHGADGIVVVAFEPQDPELSSIAEAGLPCVAIDTHLIGKKASFVTSDNVGGGVAAVRHLFAAGKRRIAFVGGVATTVASSNRRLGYESGIEELGLEARDDFVLETDWQPATAYAKVRALLESEAPPDAFFCVSDELALGTMHAIEESGRRIPDDVAVVGFDDADFARVITPSLTSIPQDRIGLGATALEALLQMLEKPDAPFPVSVLPVALVERESSSTRKPELEQAEPVGSSSRGRLSIAAALSMLTWGTEVAPGLADAPAFASATPKRADQRPLIAVALGTAPEQSFPRGFLHEVFLDIRAQAHAHEIDLLVLANIEALRDSSEETLVDYYRSLRARGLVILSQPRREGEVVALAEAGFPCVAVGIDLLGKGIGFVISDNVGGAAKAVSHLAEAGHTRIAFIGGRADTRATVDRHFGYQGELERLGIEYRQEYVAMAGWLPEIAHDEMKRMLSLAEPPDAVFCGSDVMAIAAMSAIEEAGLRIPEDIAVVGFDDMEYAALMTPSLTTVRQDPKKIAEAVVKSILRLLDNPDEPPAFVLPVELVVRESAPSANPDRAPEPNPT